MQPSGQNAQEECSRILNSKVPGSTLLFATITGSHQYGLATHKSDLDYAGVYVCDTKKFLSIDPKLPHTTLGNLPGEEPDYRIYEVKQYVQLLIEGNPFAIELLFSTRFVWSTNCWRHLLTLPHCVLNAKAVEAYLSYIEGQLQQHRARPLKGKRIYHVFRLLHEIDRIIQGETPMVLIAPDSEEFKDLVAIKGREEVGVDSLLDRAFKWMAVIRAKRPWKIPDGPDRAVINDWLIECRMKALKGTIAPEVN